jgi:glucose/arabinose dehydrogenase
MYVANFTGFVQVFTNGEIQQNYFINLQDQVNGTRGLLDIAVHPDFENNPYVYFAYAYDPPEVNEHTGLAGPDGTGNRVSRVTRVTADVTTGYTTAIAGSEVVLLGANGTWENFNASVDSTVDFDEPPAGILEDGSNLQDFLAIDSQSHSVNSVEFGPDGMLYVSNGDGTSYNQADPRSVRVQDIDNLSGKVLRVDPITGEGLADNPFFNGDVDANRSKVYQYGFRNPFRIAIDDASGQVYVGDVGWSHWEEINAGGPGDNFGWPYYEGGHGIATPTILYQDLPEAQAFYASGETTVPSLLGLQHDVDNIDALTLGDIYTGTDLGAEYQNSLIYSRLGSGVVQAVLFTETGDVDEIKTIALGHEFLVQMVSAPDGHLYFVDFDDGTIGYWTLV